MGPARPLAPDAGGQGRRRGHGRRPGMWSGGDDCRVPGTYGTCQQPAGGPPPGLKPSVRRGCEGRRPPSQGQGRRLVGVIPICADARGLRSPVTDAGGWPGQNLPVTCEVAAVPAGGGPPCATQAHWRTAHDRKGVAGAGTVGSIAIDTRPVDVGHALPARSGYPGELVRKGLTRPSRGCSDLYNFRGVTIVERQQRFRSLSHRR